MQEDGGSGGGARRLGQREEVGARDRGQGGRGIGESADGGARERSWPERHRGGVLRLQRVKQHKRSSGQRRWTRAWVQSEQGSDGS